MLPSLKAHDQQQGIVFLYFKNCFCYVYGSY
jgi:hypothetical protein